MVRRHLQVLCLVLSLLVWVINASAESPADADQRDGVPSGTEPAMAPKEPFIILPQSEVVKPYFGMAMIRPQQDHGTVDEAYRKLQGILEDWPDDKRSTIWVTRANQMATVEHFAPLVDRVVVNPFVHPRTEVSPEGDPVWRKCDHPFLNEFREMYSKNGGARLLAIVEVPGEPIHFTKRSASVEEVEWMVYAVIGGNFKGILWRGRPQDPVMIRRVGRLEARLRSHVGELGRAEPVDWVQPTEEPLVSALTTDKTLFVVLLSQQYMRPDPVAKQVVLPLTPATASGDVKIVAPHGVAIRSARTLAGKAVEVRATAEGTVLPFAFEGAGEMMVCELARAAEQAE